MTAPALLVAALAAAAAFGAVMLLSASGEEASEPAAGPATGMAVFSRMGCGSCHQLRAADSNGTIGPNLDERLEGHTAESLKAKIIAPPKTGVMPGDFAERMSDRELDALVGFLLAARP